MTSHSHSINNSLRNWQSKRCDFCMYHDLIFDQLQRLKQAMIMKNQRIKELQDFISKMSEMAFMKNPIMSVSHQINNVLISKNHEANEDQNSSISLNSQNDSKNIFFKKKFEDQSEISFQDMKLNTAKFQVKTRQSPNFMGRFEKIKELNQLKKKLDKQISETTDKQNDSFSQKLESFNNSRQYETIRTLSEPQQQGKIGSIDHSSCQITSRLKQFDQQKIKFQDVMNSLNSQTDKVTNQSLRKSNSFEDKNSINLIRQYIKKLQ